MKNLLLVCLTILLFASCTNNSKEISQWRGDMRDGIYHENDLLKEWPVDGPQLKWEFDDIGNGYGSPTITSHTLYIQGEVDSIGYLYAFDLEGNLKWKSPYGKEWMVSYIGSRSAPTVYHDNIYTCSGRGEVYCFDKEGNKIWSKNMVSDLNGRINRFGYSQSPLVDDMNIYLAPGGVDTNLVALNRFNGDIVWTSKAIGKLSAYCSPLMINLPERNILCTFSETELIGIDASTGEMLWLHDQESKGDIHGNTPTYDNGFIYYVAGTGKWAVKLKLSEDGSKIELVWQEKSMDNLMGGYVKVGDKLIGSGHRKQEWRSVDINTGQLVDTLSFGRGSTIFADGMVYAYNEDGMIGLIDPSNGLELISSFKIEQGTLEHFSQPVIRNKTLYLRHGKVLMAFAI